MKTDLSFVLLLSNLHRLFVQGGRTMCRLSFGPHRVSGAAHYVQEQILAHILVAAHNLKQLIN